MVALIDDIILRRQDVGDTGSWNNTWYHITDTLFSTVAIIGPSAALVERVSYDAYGNARHHRAADLTGNGAVDGSDQLILQGNWGNYGVGDLNRDGNVDGTDLLILQGNWGGALVAGELSQTDNIIGYAGYIFNAELVSAGSSGLYTVRHRHYAPDLGRWLSRDPIGYVDGMSLYEYVRGRPTKYVDFNGWAGVVPEDYRQWRRDYDDWKRRKDDWDRKRPAHPMPHPDHPDYVPDPGEFPEPAPRPEDYPKPPPPTTPTIPLPPPLPPTSPTIGCYAPPDCEALYNYCIAHVCGPMPSPVWGAPGRRMRDQWVQCNSACNLFHLECLFRDDQNWNERLKRELIDNPDRIAPRRD